MTKTAISSQLEYRFDCHAFGRIFKSLVDLVKVVEFDQPVKGELARLEEFDKFGNEYPRHRVAFNDAGHALAFRHKIIVDVDGHLWCHADDGNLPQWAQGMQA